MLLCLQRLRAAARIDDAMLHTLVADVLGRKLDWDDASRTVQVRRTTLKPGDLSVDLKARLRAVRSRLHRVKCRRTARLVAL